MKKIFRILFIPLLLFGASLKAQVTLSLISPEPQTGQYNYFGVRVTLSQTYPQDVIVEGYIYDESVPSTDHPWTLTVPAGYLTAETSITFYQTGPANNADAVIGRSDMVQSYAGVNITYDLQNNILKFASLANLTTVIEQLDADYDYHNDSYDALQDTTRTGDQQDSVDIVNGFNEFQTFINFENLFPGYTSMRAAIAATEASWLDGGFEGTNPDNIDNTFDDAENAIFNSSYSFKVGNDVYQLTSTGLYLNSVLIAQSKLMTEDIMYASGYLEDEGARTGIGGSAVYAPTYADHMLQNLDYNAKTFTLCKSNKRDAGDYFPPGVTDRKFRCKVAIHSIGIKSSIKGKVVHFKYKGGKWKRAKTKMRVSVGGYVTNTACASLGLKSDFNPTNQGYKKRQQLKARKGDVGVWKTLSGDILMSFVAADGYSTSKTLTF